MQATRNIFEETGGACRAGADGCRHVECRFNLRGDKRARPLHLPIWSCALAAADEGPITAADIAQCMGVTRARVGQIEAEAIGKVRWALRL